MTYGNETNRRPAAVALHYGNDGAPRVTAKGMAELAARIESIARQHDVPLYHDPELTHLLSQVPLGDEIPPALYRAVSSVIAFAYELSGKWARLEQDADDTGHAATGENN
jgi:flagellar biosynthesis protein